MIKNGFPKNDGFFMPAEFSPHYATVMAWPVRGGSFAHGGRNAKPVFAEIIKNIIKGERVFLICDKKHTDELSSFFTEDELNLIDVVNLPTDDAWTRDTSPTFVINSGKIRGIDWVFNAWGGDYDGLLPSYKNDDALAGSFCKYINCDYYDCHPQGFVLEGGSIHSDGEGTVIVTEACLLSKGRNPKLSKSEIENLLLSYLGAEKVIWLPYGIYNDETNEHVDNICAFVKPGEVVLAWCDNENDPQYAMSLADYNVLKNETDSKGRSLKIHQLPIPKKPVLITEEDIKGYDFEDGETEREIGERLAASYVNFYISNFSVLVPQFGDENDEKAVLILSKLFPGRKTVPIASRSILVGGGNIHCVTSQIPDFYRF